MEYEDIDDMAGHNRSALELFDVRKQEVRLFLPNFTTVHGLDGWVERNNKICSIEILKCLLGWKLWRQHVMFMRAVRML